MFICRLVIVSPSIFFALSSCIFIALRRILTTSKRMVMKVIEQESGRRAMKRVRGDTCMLFTETGLMYAAELDQIGDRGG
jgi:hypothetical protein